MSGRPLQPDNKYSDKKMTTKTSPTPFSSPPQHVAIIMDGNGRWAARKNVPSIQGHRAGAETLRRISKAAHAVGVRYLTLYAFSTENWRRPKHWILDLMGLLRHYLRHELNDLLKNNVRLETIGDLSAFDKDIQTLIQEAKEKTAKNTGLTLILALNYGGRAELAQAVKKIALEVKEDRLSPEEITQETIAAALYTAPFPDPDLVIRTSGENRISNFLLWQSAYSEYVFVDALWPDFTADDFKTALMKFYTRERRYGAAIAS